MRKSIELSAGSINVPKSKHFDKLSEVGARYNKKRGFIFLSKVLGKYLDTKPSVMTNIFKELASKIDTSTFTGKTLVIGFAETATALGEGTFEMMGLKNSFYISTTRTKIDGKEIWLSFNEEHSHATSHIIYVPSFNIDGFENIILIDDEFTTGKTLKNISVSLKRQLPSVKKIIAMSILDWSPDSDISKKSIFQADFSFKSNGTVCENIFNSTSDKSISVGCDTSRFGRCVEHISNKRDAYVDRVVALVSNYPKNKSILVVGSGEFMFEPYLIAREIECLGYDVFMKSTGRSPIKKDGPIFNVEKFSDHAGEGLDFFLYNMKKWDVIVYLPEILLDSSSTNILTKYTDNLIVESYNIFNEKLAF